jgi:hypothetical protein
MHRTASALGGGAAHLGFRVTSSDVQYDPDICVTPDI